MSNATETRHACPIRLTASGVAITSPRTQTTLEVPADACPRHLRQRIVAARAVGAASAEFTGAELRTFVQAVPSPKAPVALHGGWFIQRNGKRYAR